MADLYALQCGIFSKNNIITVLKHNNFHFFNDNKTLEDDYSRYLSINEDKIYFMDTVVALNTIIVGYTFRSGINDSAFTIYFPNQTIQSGFNYNAEFSKALLTLDPFNFDSETPITSINLHAKNIDKFISEDDITSGNISTRTIKKFKTISFEEYKKKKIEKLFLYKQKDFYLVIGWTKQGKKNRNTIIYNKNFTEFLMTIQSIDLNTPQGLDLKSNKKNIVGKDKKPIQNANETNFNSDLEPDNLVNPFKHKSKSTSKSKKDILIDHTPNIAKINSILDKINRLGIRSLTIEEMMFLKNNSGNV